MKQPFWSLKLHRTTALESEGITRYYTNIQESQRCFKRYLRYVKSASAKKCRFVLMNVVGSRKLS